MGELVSIVVPVYNAEKTIKRCINSLINQTYKELEIILIDDGSRDSSCFLCKKAAIEDNRIKYLYQENKGVSAARNYGISVCTGQWILFVDADDELELNAVQIVMEIQKIGMYDTVCWNAFYVDGKNKTKMNVFCPPTKIFSVSEKQELIYAMYIDDNENYYGDYFRACWGKLLSAEIIKKNCLEFPEGVPIGEDALFLVRYFNNCKNVILTSRYLYNYYRGEETVTRKYKDNFYELQKKEFDSLEQILKIEKLEEKEIFISFWHKAEKNYIQNELKSTDGIIKRIKRIIQYLNKDHVRCYLSIYDGKGLKSRIRSLLEKCSLCIILAMIDYLVLARKK